MQDQQQRAERILKSILDDNDRKIYAIIKEHPSTKKDLVYRTKFPTNLLDKILKELASYNLIKSIKRPESKNMNVWVLANHKQEDQGQVIAEGKQDLMNFIRKKEGSHSIPDLQKDAIRKGVNIDNFDQILNILELRGEIYQQGGKVTKRQTGTFNAPCFECALRNICEPDGVISPKGCPYLLAW